MIVACGEVYVLRGEVSDGSEQSVLALEGSVSDHEFLLEEEEAVFSFRQSGRRFEFFSGG